MINFEIRYSLMKHTPQGVLVIVSPYGLNFHQVDKTTKDKHRVELPYFWIEELVRIYD